MVLAAVRTRMYIEPEPLATAVSNLREERTEPLAYLEACLDRLEEVDDTLCAFCPEPDRRDRTREATRALADADVGNRPLFGVPVGVKDIFHVDGLETRAGSDLPPEVLAGPEADAVSALREAGAVVFGKTVTTEFAYFEPGPTRNPHDVGHTPGGSSSGSAAAVAAGICPLALGSQTIGSVIRPASFCGVVGVKPTYDRIPTDGVVPVAPSVDHVGYFTQDVAGARIAGSVLCSDFDEDAATGSVSGRPTLGVPGETYLSQADAETRAFFERRLEVFRAAGYEIRETDAIADITGVNDRHDDLVSAEMALAHTELYADYGDRYAETTASYIERGQTVDVGRLVAARNSRLRLRKRLAETGVDVWVSPAAPGPAPAGIDDTGDPVMNLPWTHAGVPTVGLPAGRVDGLPVGLQFAAGFGEDERLLAVAEELESILGETGE